jgi:hypothetical protein
MALGGMAEVTSSSCPWRENADTNGNSVSDFIRGRPLSLLGECIGRFLPIPHKSATMPCGLCRKVSESKGSCADRSSSEISGGAKSHREEKRWP